MDKYRVLGLLIIYYLVLSITTAVFSSGTLNLVGQQSGAWSTIKVLFGGLVLDIPMVPMEVRALIASPFWMLLIYFIYLNTPKIAGSGSPEP